jgi:hypothetical protein
VTTFLLLAVLALMFVISRATGGKSVAQRRHSAGAREPGTSTSSSFTDSGSATNPATDCATSDGGGSADSGCSSDGGSSD